MNSEFARHPWYARQPNFAFIDVLVGFLLCVPSFHHCLQFLKAMEEMRKARLMKDMAELRLRNEVNALESQLGTPRTRDASLCLYLVPDALALCHDLTHLRKLLASEKYFIVIPRTGRLKFRFSSFDGLAATRNAIARSE